MLSSPAATMAPKSTPANLSIDVQPGHSQETDTPTPRPALESLRDAQHPVRYDDAKTPTRATFGAMASQRPFPTEPFPPAFLGPRSPASLREGLARGGSIRSVRSQESEDVSMDGMDNPSDDDDDGSGSEEETINADGTRTMKKKKTQKFYCTDYPPCNLSFTRSEHLARHIRKHTGERPFQCHCSRRFSRLDNLRQHAQTVHVNEDIPGDSLAATGARFQRQARTDRVRPPGSRSRANTAGSQTSTGRGHHRNSLSTSSIASTSSAYSIGGLDPRRRPPSLIMGADPRNRLSMESFGSDSAYRPESPAGYQSPSSATQPPGYLSNNSSPQRWPGGASPSISHSRTRSLYDEHNHVAGRRLSVPSGLNPFQSPFPQQYGHAAFTPMNSSNQATLTHMMPPGQIVASPTGAIGPGWSERRDSVSSSGSGPDEAWRRRTWHPESYNSHTSRLQQVTNASQPYAQPPSSMIATQGGGVTLPSISSFISSTQQRPATPPRRDPSPIMIDTPSRVPFPHSAPSNPGFAPGHGSMQPARFHGQPLHRDMSRLELGQRGFGMDSAVSWARDTDRALQAQADQAHGHPQHMHQHQVRFDVPNRAQPLPPLGPQQNRQEGFNASHHSAPPVTPKENKRLGWYSGPPSASMIPPQGFGPQRTSPDTSGSSIGASTPGSVGWTERGSMDSPAYVAYGGQTRNDSGYAAYENAPRGGVAPGPQGQGTYAGQEKRRPDLMRLEALVAVATSEV